MIGKQRELNNVRLLLSIVLFLYLPDVIIRKQIELNFVKCFKGESTGICVISIFLMITDIYRMYSVYLKLCVFMHLRHTTLSFSKVIPAPKISGL